MIGDRLYEAVKTLVLRVLDETDRIDPHALYPARVTSQDGATLAVEFDDERLRSKSGVAIKPPLPGQTLTFRTGTRVLVGWHPAGQGKPPAPYVAGTWDGQGGLSVLRHQVQARVELDVPLVRCTGDLERRHDLGRGGQPAIVPLVGIATLVSGTDRLFAVQVVTVLPLPPGTPLFTATFAAPYAAAPMALASGSGGGQCTTTPATVTVLAGGDAVVMSALVLAPGTRQVVVYTGAAA